MESCMQIALVGPPNCGKTTIFNALTGSSLQVGNWPGVTVERKTGQIPGAPFPVCLTDLPGICALSPFSPEEKIASDFLESGSAKMILAVVDALSPQRGLYLLSQLLTLSLPVTVAFNRIDASRRQGISYDFHALSQFLGVPVIPVSASRKEGLSDILQACLHPSGSAPRKKILPPPNPALSPYPEDYAMLAADRYDWAVRILAESGAIFPEHSDSQGPVHFTERADRILLSPVWGYPILFLCLFLIFGISFGPPGKILENLGFTDGIRKGLQSALEYFQVHIWIQNFLLDGLLAGISAAVCFLPSVLLLFFFLSLLEDSGYMARAAFLLDAPMKRLGISGKAFVPLLMGFGCTVPAILSTRILEREGERRRVLGMLPFFSCSAKTPVYLLIASQVFPKGEAAAVGGLVLFGILCSLIPPFGGSNAERFYTPFVMELPLYTRPTLHTVWNRVKQRIADFFFRAVSVLLWASALVWLLQSVSLHLKPVLQPDESILAVLGKTVSPLFSLCGFPFWQAAVALSAGLLAKENIAGCLAVLLPGTAFTQMFSPLSAVSFLVFLSLYPPCIASLSAYRKESGSLRETLRWTFRQLLFAWCASVLIYQGGLLLFPWAA